MKRNFPGRENDIFGEENRIARQPAHGASWPACGFLLPGKDPISAGERRRVEGEMRPEKLDSSIVLLRERIEQGMRGSADLILDEFELAGVKGLAFMFDGLVSNTQVSDFLLRPINRMAPPEADPEKLWEYLRSQFLFSSEQGIVETYEDLFTKAMSGFAMVMLDGVPRALSLGYQGFETRGVGEPAMEKNLRGSREGFTESNNTNTAMVRRRLKSPNLTVETLYLGRAEPHQCAPLLPQRCGGARNGGGRAAKIAGGFSAAGAGQRLFAGVHSKGAASLFSGTGTTQRPDTLCAKLAGGQSGRYGGWQPQCDDRALPLHRAFPYAG